MFLCRDNTALPVDLYYVMNFTYSMPLSTIFSVGRHLIVSSQHIWAYWSRLWFNSPCPEPSKLLGSPPVEKHPESSLQPRLLASQPRLLVVSRSPTGTGQGPWLSERSGGTRSPLSSSSVSSPSSVSSGRLPRTSRLTWGSRALLSWLSRRPARLTWLDSLKIPTCAPSTPRGSPSCPRTSSSQEESEESVPKPSDHCPYNTRPFSGPTKIINFLCFINITGQMKSQFVKL